MGRKNALGTAARDARYRSVTETFRLEGPGELIEVAPGELQTAPWQPRQDPTPESLESLVASIRAHGIIQPLLAREEEDGSLLLLAGHRRRAAALLAGLEEVPVRSLTVSDTMAQAVTLAENRAREDLSAWEEACGLGALRAALEAAGEKATRDRLAELTGRSGGAVSTSLQIADRLKPLADELPPEDRHALTNLPKAALHNACRRTEPAARTETLMRALDALAAGGAPGKATSRKRGRGPMSAPFSVVDRLNSSGRLTLELRRHPKELSPSQAQELLARLEPLLTLLRGRVDG